LYYARAVDPTMLTAVNKIASMQANATEDVEAAAQRLLSYAKKWPNASLLIKPSDMVLFAHSDASYLSEASSRSRIGGILYLGTKDDTNFVNAAVEQFSTILDVVVASAAEAEYAAIFTVAHEAEPLRHTLTELGFPQPPTLITCDNQCAVGLALNTVKEKRTKAIDMRYHWIRDRIKQNHFLIEWQPGSTNLADFFTKAHPVHHHKDVRHFYVSDIQPSTSMNSARGRHSLFRFLKHMVRSPAMSQTSFMRGCVDTP
jgi:hypothetical protein